MSVHTCLCQKLSRSRRKQNSTPGPGNQALSCSVLLLKKKKVNIVLAAEKKFLSIITEQIKYGELRAEKECIDNWHTQ